MRSFHGTFLRGRPDGTVDLAPHSKSWENWTFIYLGNSKYNIRSVHGTYLRGRPNGKVDLAPHALSWEVWT
jgi:hypothetical protein